MRLHSGRTFYSEPELPPKRPVGRPFRHGKKFDCKDLNTWPRPTGEHHESTGEYGIVRVRAWSGLHPKTRQAKERYGSESTAVVTGTVVLVEVERLPRGERRRKPKALWLWWHGEGIPDLDLLWKAYCRRFDVEHFVKFLKGALGWYHAQGAPPRTSGSLDVAGARCLRATLAHQGHRRRPQIAVGASVATLFPDSDEDLEEFRNTTAQGRHAGKGAKTPWKVTRWAEGQPFWPREAYPAVKKAA